MAISLSSVSPAAVDANGGAKLSIEGDFSEHIGEDFEVELVSRLTNERLLALTGKPGSPTTIQPANSDKMVCYAPRLIGTESLLFSDPLSEDRGYWDLATAGGSTIAFVDDWAQISGTLFPDIDGASLWSGYKVVSDIRVTSTLTGFIGASGVGGHLSDLDVSPSGYYAGINPLENNCYSVNIIDAVGYAQAYSYAPFGTLVNGQVYRIETTLQMVGANTVRTRFTVDGNEVFTEQLTNCSLAGWPFFIGITSGGHSSEFRDLSVTSLSGQKLGTGIGGLVVNHDLVVSLADGSVSATLSDALQSFPRQYNTSVFGYRSTLPPTYRTGPRNPGLLERIT
jgi:hypothetical protein